MTPEDSQLAQALADQMFTDFISQCIDAANKPYSISWPKKKLKQSS